MKRTKKKKKGRSAKSQLTLVLSLILGVVFIPTSIVLSIGMLPTIVATFADRSKGKLKSLTVGAMNFAGCVPFIIELWKEGHTVDNAMSYITEPKTIITIYFAAAVGYLIDWSMTGIVSSIMAQKGKKRLVEIEKEQKALEKRWGKEVSGELILDEYGFPMPTEDELEAKK